jgi:hypothetical protein
MTVAKLALDAAHLYFSLPFRESAAAASLRLRLLAMSPKYNFARALVKNPELRRLHSDLALV